MRHLGRLGSAALVGPAVLLIAACGHSSMLAPASSPTPGTSQTAAAGTTAVPSSLTTTPGSTSGNAGVSSDQLNQIDNQINQIDNQISQADQGLATSEGDPTQ
jgi:ABC-type sugar transport system substrate-binding protein